jgi:hypothetical protein
MQKSDVLDILITWILFGYKLSNFYENKNIDFMMLPLEVVILNWSYLNLNWPQ